MNQPLHLLLCPLSPPSSSPNFTLCLVEKTGDRTVSQSQRRSSVIQIHYLAVIESGFCSVVLRLAGSAFLLFLVTLDVTSRRIWFSLKNRNKAPIPTHLGPFNFMRTAGTGSALRFPLHLFPSTCAHL